MGAPREHRLPTLGGSRIVLRWLEERDVPALFEIFSDDDVCRYWSALPMTDPAQARELLEEVHEYFRSGTLFQWGITRRDDDRVIGTTTLASIERTHRRCEIGFAVARSAWGRGYASEAIDLAIEHAFEELRMHRIEADVDPRNERSIRTLESAGFEREGYMRERYHLGGEAHDAVFYGLLEPQWKKRS